jgi:hypothetical protein
MRYLLPIALFLAALALIGQGLLTAAGAGICDQCSGDTTPGKLEVVAGGACLVASVVSVAWASRER